jgi:hypothetical protein
MRTTKTARPDKTGLPEEAFRIEETELVKKRQALAQAMAPSLRYPQPEPVRKR